MLAAVIVDTFLNHDEPVLALVMLESNRLPELNALLAKSRDKVDSECKWRALAQNMPVGQRTPSNTPSIAVA